MYIITVFCHTNSQPPYPAPPSQMAIQERTRDPKKDLEEHLRRVCEKFIAECSERIAGELAPLTSKVQGGLKGSVPTSAGVLRQSLAARKCVAAVVLRSGGSSQLFNVSICSWFFLEIFFLCVLKWWSI